MRLPGLAEEQNLQFGMDAAAFVSLSARQKNTAVFWARQAFACRQGLVAANDFVMRGTDWFYEKALLAPVQAVRRPLMKAFSRAARNKAPPEKNSEKKPRPGWWAATKAKIAQGGKKTWDFLEGRVGLALYRATAWAFNPRTKSGKPVFGNETANKLAGSALGFGAFVALSAWVGWLEIMSKVWHAQIAARALTSHAPWALRLAKQAVIHPAVSLAAGAAQLLVVPSIAAARHALKATRLGQGIAYQYNARLRSFRETQPEPAPPPGWRPSTSVNGFFNEIVEKSAPEFYLIKQRELEALRQKPAVISTKILNGAESAPVPTAPAKPVFTGIAPPAAGFNGQAGRAKKRLPPPGARPAAPPVMGL